MLINLFDTEMANPANKLNEELNKLKSEIEKALIKVGFNKEILDNNWLQNRLKRFTHQ